MSDLKEIAERCRRIETRLTRYLEMQGVDAGGLKPIFVLGEIRIPNKATSVQDCLNVIPPMWNPDEEIFVTHKGEYVMSIFTAK
jgi:hypothetical protein